MKLEKLPPRLLAAAGFLTELAGAAVWLRYRVPHLLRSIKNGEPIDDSFFGFGERPGPKVQTKRRR